MTRLLRNKARIARYAMVVIAASSRAYGDSVPCNPELAERERFRIVSVMLTAVSDGAAVSNLRNNAFSRALLEQSRSDVESSITSPPGGASRFHFRNVVARCTWMDIGTKEVQVEIRADDVAVVEGDTVSRLMDEIDRDSSVDLGLDRRMNLRFDHDQAMGHIIGASLGVHDRPLSPYVTQSLRADLGGWTNPSRTFYHLGFSAEQVTWSADRRNLHTSYLLGLWCDRVPLAGMSILSKGMRGGVGLELQRPGVDVKTSFAGRLTETNVNAAQGALPHRAEFALESATHIEWVTDGGFIRLGSWEDYGRTNDNSRDYGRAVAFARYYTDVGLSSHQSFTVDFSASTGVSGGAVPVYRQFAGGNRYDPPLGDSFYPADEFTWAGPFFRGGGVSTLYSPSGPIQATVAGGHFAGLNFTLGLPLYAEPRLRSVNVLESANVREVIQHQLDFAAGRTVDASLHRSKTGAGRQEELRRSLSNLIRHTRSLSIRPILAADAAQVAHAGMVSRAAEAVGFGLRLRHVNWGGELLYMRVVHDSWVEMRDRNAVVLRVYTSPRIGPRK